MLTQIDRFPPTHTPSPTQLSPQPTIHPTAHIVDSAVGGWTELGPYTGLVESTFADFSYTAGYASIIYTDVGKFCSIAAQVRINPGNHPMQRVSQHHFTYRRAQYGFGPDDEDFFNWRRDQRCVIGHDVWIGHGAIIMPGVKIGTGAVIGAGAVVTRDIAPYTIAVGMPARPIRRRFPDALCDKLLQIAWWDWEYTTLQARFADLLDVAGFVEKYG